MIFSKKPIPFYVGHIDGGAIMKIFLDTTCLHHLKDAQKTGLIYGITTNPSLMANFFKQENQEENTKKNHSFSPEVSEESSGRLKEAMTIMPHCLEIFPLYWWHHVQALCALCPGDVSLQVNHREDMVAQGIFYSLLAPNVVVKVPATPEGFQACRVLEEKSIKVNVTLCFTPFQALLAAQSHAHYVSPFLGRLNAWCEDKISGKNLFSHDHQNGQEDGPSVLGLFQHPEFALEKPSFGGNLIHHIRRLFDTHGYKTQILAASLRTLQDVEQSLYFGAHGLTLSPQLFWMLFKHPLTTQGLDIFAKNFSF